jgi:hypothetical protein
MFLVGTTLKSGRSGHATPCLNSDVIESSLGVSLGLNTCIFFFGIQSFFSTRKIHTHIHMYVCISHACIVLMGACTINTYMCVCKHEQYIHTYICMYVCVYVCLGNMSQENTYTHI